MTGHIKNKFFKNYPLFTLGVLKMIISCRGEFVEKKVTGK